MIEQLCQFWEGPTLGELPEVNVWILDSLPNYCCTFTFDKDHDCQKIDHVAMAKHIASLHFKSGDPIFGHVNVTTATNYHFKCRE